MNLQGEFNHSGGSINQKNNHRLLTYKLVLNSYSRARLDLVDDIFERLLKALWLSTSPLICEVLWTLGMCSSSLAT